MPVIVPASGNGLTVISIVSTAVPHMLVTLYDIIVAPAEAPVTTPPEMVAAEELLLQVPPEVVLVRFVVAATQTEGLPVMVPATGSGLTATSIVSTAVPHVLVTL